MSGKFNMDDYVDVAERIVLFRNKYPEGSLQATVLRYPGEGFPFVVVEARAYRTPDDERPGIGLAWEPMPGRTPFTKDSELMVCETSAWGRAIVAVGAADTKRGIASRNEIQARQNVEERSGSTPPEPNADSSRPGSSTPASQTASRSDSSAPFDAIVTIKNYIGDHDGRAKVIKAKVAKFCTIQEYAEVPEAWENAPSSVLEAVAAELVPA